MPVADEQVYKLAKSQQKEYGPKQKDQNTHKKTGKYKYKNTKKEVDSHIQRGKTPQQISLPLYIWTKFLLLLLLGLYIKIESYRTYCYEKSRNDLYNEVKH